MKKIIFMIILFTFFLCNVEAFSIDVDKIDLNSRSKQLTDELDKAYKIDVSGFDSKINNDSNIVNLTKEFVSISLSSDDKQAKKEKLVENLYVSNSNGFDTLTGSMAIDLYLDRLDNLKIKADTIKDIKTSTINDNDIMAFAYLDDCETEYGTKDIIMAFWLKYNDSEYGLYYPWLTIEDDLEEYFSSVIEKEDDGNIIGGSYSRLSIDGDSNEVSKDVLNNLYEKNKNSVVQITGMNSNGLGAYGSGFFITEGVVVTSWNLFRQILTDSNYVYVNDVSGNTYEVLGVVAAQSDYDVVVLKLNKVVGTSVIFGSSESLQETDKIFMINSMANSNFSIKYGTFLSQENGRLKNMFLLNESDVGASIFNEKGEVVAINTGDLLNSDLSYANSTVYLHKLQDVLAKQGYEKIVYTSLDLFRENYYVNVMNESIRKNVDDKVWDKYKKIGNIEDNISLELVKSSYKDEILSLRYKNKADKMLDSIYLISNFVEELNSQGFRLTYEDNNKKIYKNDKYKIVIKDNFNYLIVLMMGI